jgi:hypothetical protein
MLPEVPDWVEAEPVRTRFLLAPLMIMAAVDGRSEVGSELFRMASTNLQTRPNLRVISRHRSSTLNPTFLHPNAWLNPPPSQSLR